MRNRVTSWLGWIIIQVVAFLVLYELAYRSVELLRGPVRPSVVNGLFVMSAVPVFAVLAMFNGAALAASRFASTRVLVLAICLGVWGLYVQPTLWTYRIPALVFAAGTISLVLPMFMSYFPGLARRVRTPRIGQRQVRT